MVCEDQTIPVEGTGPYYGDDSQYYPDYGYNSQDSTPSLLDRQGIETVLGAPLVITAFVAALVGGIVGPLISDGLARLGEYEIQWPQVRRKIIQQEEEEGRTWSWVKEL